MPAYRRRTTDAPDERAIRQQMEVNVIAWLERKQPGLSADLDRPRAWPSGRFAGLVWYPRGTSRSAVQQRRRA